jgi:hypothetical protein
MKLGFSFLPLLVSLSAFADPVPCDYSSVANSPNMMWAGEQWFDELEEFYGIRYNEKSPNQLYTERVHDERQLVPLVPTANPEQKTYTHTLHFKVLDAQKQVLANIRSVAFFYEYLIKDFAKLPLEGKGHERHSSEDGTYNIEYKPYEVLTLNCTPVAAPAKTK